MAEKLDLAYSGGLDISVLGYWIKDMCGYDLTTSTADAGQKVLRGVFPATRAGAIHKSHCEHTGRSRLHKVAPRATVRTLKSK